MDSSERKDSSDRAVSVVVVEDNRLTREGIVTILGRHADIEVVGVAEDAGDALRRVSETDVDIVLLDASLGDHDSHRLVESILEASPESRVVVMDIVSDPEDIIQFVRRGASGFVVKDADIETFVETIRAVARGDQVLPDALTGTLFSHIASESTTRTREAPEGVGRMTPREREVIDLIAEGASNKRISRELGISVHTVKSPHEKHPGEAVAPQSARGGCLRPPHPRGPARRRGRGRRALTPSRRPPSPVPTVRHGAHPSE